jgi:hypothetical protein
MRGQKSSGGRRALCVDRTAAEGGELNAWTEQQRMVGSCLDRSAAKGGELYAWTERQRREESSESSMRGKKAAEGGKLYSML